ncbi:hypothetical protein H9P43_008506 [Blastocladiella emersonii ATCC 22665]|nr:hypothetical protein H9P43_008506 [Blastocladiella emersonii ATCC 22665]
MFGNLSETSSSPRSGLDSQAAHSDGHGHHDQPPAPAATLANCSEVGNGNTFYPVMSNEGEDEDDDDVSDDDVTYYNDSYGPRPPIVYHHGIRHQLRRTKSDSTASDAGYATLRPDSPGDDESDSDDSGDYFLGDHGPRPAHPHHHAPVLQQVGPDDTVTVDKWASKWDQNDNPDVYGMTDAVADAEYLGTASKYRYSRKVVGKGANGIVYLAVPKTVFDRADGVPGVAYVCKIVRKNMNRIDANGVLRHELRVIRLIDHAHVVKLHDFADSGIKSCIYMEIALGGNLLAWLIKNGGRVSEHRAQYVMRQLVDGLGYLHSNGITHRNIKPENVLVRGGDNDDPAMPFVLLADYWLAKDKLDQNLDAHMFTRCGTDTYTAPEIRLPELYVEYDRRSSVDAWSLGMVLVDLLGGWQPLAGSVQEAVRKRICDGDFSFAGELWLSEQWNTVSAPAKNLIERMLLRNGDQRPTMDQCKVDAWITADLSSAVLAKNLTDASVPFTVAVPSGSLLPHSDPTTTSTTTTLTTTTLTASTTPVAASKYELSDTLSTVSLSAATTKYASLASAVEPGERKRKFVSAFGHQSMPLPGAHKNARTSSPKHPLRGPAA